MTTTWKMPRLTKEWVGGITVTVDGVPVNDFQVAIVPRRLDPVEDDWRAPDLLEGKQGILIGPGTDMGMLDKGDYRVWTRFESNPEKPVLNDVGIVILT